MAASVDDAEIRALLAQAQRGTLQPAAFPSPTDWRDVWIYFALLDRFGRDGGKPPLSTLAKPPVNWNSPCGFRQGGNFNGLAAQLPASTAIGRPRLHPSGSAPADGKLLSLL